MKAVAQLVQKQRERGRGSQGRDVPCKNSYPIRKSS